VTSLASSTCSGSEGYVVSQHQYKKNSYKSLITNWYAPPC
jgi:hypothetical protein